MKTIFPELAGYKSTYGTYETAENAGRLMAHLTTIIPENIIALRNVIIQSADSGLTTQTIFRAFQSFADFDWGVTLSFVAPVDIANIQTAIERVGANLYFGFNNQMGAASAKNFPTLAYASFQLCIKAGGDMAMKNYQGMPKTTPGKAQVDQMIAEYLENRANI